MPTRAMRLKTQARVLACLQAVCLTLSVVKEQSLFASLMRLEKELFPLYLKKWKTKKMTVLHIFHAFSRGKTPWFSTVFPFLTFPSAYIYRRGWKNLIFGAAKRGWETVQCTLYQMLQRAISEVAQSNSRCCTEQYQM